MESSDKDQGQKGVSEIKTFKVPFSLGEINRNIIINSPYQPSKEKVINQAFKFHSEGNISEAKKYYKLLISQGVKDYRVFSNYGEFLKDNGNLKEAEKYVREAIKLNSNSSNDHKNLGSILIQTNQIDEAKIEIQKAIKLNPNFEKAHLNLGVIFKSKFQLKEAEISTRKAIELNPDFAMGHCNLGGILRDTGNLQEAEISTRKAIELNPKYAMAHANLGTILCELGKQEEAMKSWIKAVELKPELEQAVRSLAINLNYEKKYELTLKYLNRNQSDSVQTICLGCLLSLDREVDFNEKYEELTEKNVCNADMGGIVEHANIIYDKQYESPFCNEAIKYVFIEKINETDFSENSLNELISYNERSKKDNKSQGLLVNGIQSSGNLFLLDYPFIKEIKNALEVKIEKYKQTFKDSGQGFISNWPADYELRSWMISMKNGGFLKSHNHEYGWITGSFYLQIPKYNKKNKNAGNIAFSYQGPRYPNKGKKFNLTVKKLETRDICIFPSSLFHQTIPFESSEERICFVFDLVQK